MRIMGWKSREMLGRYGAGAATNARTRRLAHCTSATGYEAAGHG
jgi:hypothetical protein